MHNSDYIYIKNSLGEGITYLDNTETLVWVDIENNKSFELCLKNKKIEDTIIILHLHLRLKRANHML